LAYFKFPATAWALQEKTDFSIVTFKIKNVKSLSIALSRIIKHDNVKITRKGGAGLQRDNNLAGKIQREWTLLLT
jgi:hypothetical protein